MKKEAFFKYEALHSVLSDLLAGWLQGMEFTGS